MLPEPDTSPQRLDDSTSLLCFNAVTCRFVACQVSANGMGFATYSMTPAQPLAVGSYSVVATYTPTANFVYGSTSSPYVFTVTPAVTTPPPTSEPLTQGLLNA